MQSSESFGLAVDVFITASDDCRHICVRDAAVISSDDTEKGISVRAGLAQRLSTFVPLLDGVHSYFQAKVQLKSLCVDLLDRQGHLICSMQLEVSSQLASSCLHNFHCWFASQDSVANLSMMNSDCVADLSIGSVCCYDRYHRSSRYPF